MVHGFCYGCISSRYRKDYKDWQYNDIINQYDDMETLNNKYRIHTSVIQNQRLNDEKYRDMVLRLLGSSYKGFGA